MATRFLAPLGGGDFDPFAGLQRDVYRLFDDVFRSQPARAAAATLAAPRLDMHQTEQGLEVSVELPGVTRDDVDLRIEGDILTIRGHKRSERQDEQAHVVERAYGSFQRAIRLPSMPDASQVTASFENGVLKIVVPKAALPEKSRRIEIRGASATPPSNAETADRSGQAAQGTATPEPSAQEGAGPGPGEHGAGGAATPV